jgi:hypothetical protein
MRRSPRLPKRFPVGTKYILESHGQFVRRLGADILDQSPQKSEAKFDFLFKKIFG